MRVITNRRLLEFSAIHHDAAGSLQAWRKAVESSEFWNFADLRNAIYVMWLMAIPLASRSPDCQHTGRRSAGMTKELHWIGDRTIALYDASAFPKT
jgi:hypothetical protein